MKIKTKITIKKHFNNLGLLLVSGFLGFIGMTLLEYEIAKIRNPEVLFLKTPSVLVSITSELMIIFSIVIISMLILIYWKKLDNRQWLWYAVIFEFLLFLVSVFAIGTTKFDIIVFG